MFKAPHVYEVRPRKDKSGVDHSIMGAAVVAGVADCGFFVGGGFRRDPKLKDVRMPIFVLAVFYAGLFAILGDNKRKEQ